jgi:hypothetical protein
MRQSAPEVVDEFSIARGTDVGKHRPSGGRQFVIAKQ